MMTDVDSLKTVIEGVEKVGIVGICVYVINILGKIILHLMKSRKLPNEMESKNLSRLRILETNTKVISLHKNIEPFFDMRNKVNDIHKIVTKDDNGTPLMYNPGLDKSMAKLNRNAEEQIKLLTKIADGK